MESISTTDFLKAINGRAENQDNLPKHVTRISLDSRTLKPGDVFWAIHGDNFDGHRFIDSALTQGASALIVHETYKAEQFSNRLILVADTLIALNQFAQWYRSQFSPLAIGITGSFGKTSTRELLHAVLSVKQPGLQSQKNYNNEIGVPLTVLDLERQHRFLVIEMGAAKPGDIIPLTEIASPHFGIITGIGPAHLSGFQNIAQIVQTKGDLIARLPEEGLAFIPGDSEWTNSLRDRAACRVITFGQTSDSTYYASNIHLQNTHLTIEVRGHSYRLPVSGRHHLTNGLAIIAVATELGYAPQEIQEGFNEYKSVPGRANIRQTMPWTIIDDTYNSNPTSCRAACEILAGWKQAGRRILVLGDMLELGAEAESYHEELGRFAAEQDIDVIFALGEYAGHIIRGVISSQKPNRTAKSFDEPQRLIREIQNILRPKDVLLVKGSRGMRMERIVEPLLKSVRDYESAFVA